MKTTRDILLVILFTLTLLFIVEITVRMLFKGEPPPPEINPELLAYEFDSLCLVKMKADVTKVFVRNAVNGGDTIFWKTDQFGFRTADKNHAEAKKIMVFGDSNVQGRFSRFENTFSSKLEAYLNGINGDEYAVINAGTIGFGPDQSFLKLQQNLRQFKPEIVLLQVFADNDYGDLIRNRLFELDSRGNLLKTTFKAEPDMLLQGKRPNNKPVFRTLELIQLVKRNYIGQETPSVSEAKAQEIASLIELCEQEFKVYQRKNPRKYSIFADHYDIDIAAFPHLESSKTKIKLMEKLLIEIKEYLDAANTELLVLIQPSSIDLTPNQLIDFKDLDQFPDYSKYRLTSSIEEICIQNGIPSLNLFSVFEKNHPTHLFFKYPNNHWNDAGQDLAAMATAEKLIGSLELRESN